MESIKDQIKTLAKKKSLSIDDVANHLKMSNQGLYKHFRLGTIKLNQLEAIAEFLEVEIPDLLPSNNEKLVQVGSQNENYGTRIDKNNFFSGSNEELIKLRTENEQLKTIIDKQDKEIEFLRGQLMK